MHDTNIIPQFDLLNFLLFYLSNPAVEVPNNLPFPDGNEVSPEIKVETLTGNCSHSNTLEIQLALVNQYVKDSIRQLAGSL